MYVLHGVGIESIIGVLHGSRVITIQASTSKLKRKEMKRIESDTEQKVKFLLEVKNNFACSIAAECACVI